MKWLPVAIITIALLFCGCNEEGQSSTPLPITTPTETPPPPASIITKTKTPTDWLGRTSTNTLKDPEMDKIRQHIELGVRNDEIFGTPYPEVKSVYMNGDEVYTEYTSNKFSDTEIFMEMQEVAKLIREAFIGYEKPNRVTIKAIPQKNYNYETNLLWEEFIKLSNKEMPNSEWSRNTARSS